MRKTGWAPPIVPKSDDGTVYLVMDSFGQLGRIWTEADAELTDLETVIFDLLEGQYKDPVRVIGFNTAEGWSQDVSVDVAHELRRRCDLQQRDVLPAKLHRPLRRSLSRHAAAAADALGLEWRSSARSPRRSAKASSPGFVEPALASSIARVPTGERTVGPRDQVRRLPDSGPPR
jgi:hypothetical protein